MKDRVLDLLKKNSDQKYNSRQLAHYLELHSSEHKVLRKTLKTLTHEGKIITDRQQRYCLRDESRVLKGNIKIHKDGFGFVVPESTKKEDVFIPQKHINYAMNGDLVLVESYKNPKGRKFEGRVIQILKRANEHAVGTIEKKGNQYFLNLRDAKLGVAEIYIPKKNLGKAKVGDMVGVTIVQYPGPGIGCLGEVDNVIGVDDDVKTIVQGILYQNGIRETFSNRILDKMNTLPKNPDTDLKDNRKDLRELPFITIDGITARDFDDAVCVLRKGKTRILYVSIADVAEYVRKDSELDKEAYARSTSTYLPDRCIPMLPEKLSNGLCSLNPHVPRYTLTAEIHYNDNADFQKAVYYKSLIQSHKRTTYEEVEAYFDKTGGEDLPAKVKGSLNEMQELSKQLMQKSKERGTLGFDMPEAEIIYNAKGEIETIQKKQRLFSHKLIEEFMIAANVAVAKLFSARDLPLIYRVHDQPDSTKIQDFMEQMHNLGLGKHLEGFDPSQFFAETQDHPLSTYLQFAFLRSLKQAQYSPENIGHFGLSLQDYAHFTSPIRRYPDLIVHRQLRCLLDQTEEGILEFKPADFQRDFSETFAVLYSQSDLHKIGIQTSEREREAMEAEREVLKLTKVDYFSSHVGDEIVGTIIRIGKFGLVVQLDPHFVEGTLPFVEMKDDYYDFDEKKIRLIGRRTRRIWKVGDKIHVQVVKADLEGLQILLASLEQKNAKTNKPHKNSKRKKKPKKRGKKT